MLNNSLHRGKSILLIFAALSGMTMAQEYPESYEAVSEKYESAGFAELNQKEQAIYTIWWLEAEVSNGGFYQYFWNSSGNNAEVALKSLDAIGATKTAYLLKKAIDIAFDGELPGSRAERQRQLEVDQYSKMDKLDDLDSEFYRYSENFYKMLDEYVAK